MKRRRIVVLPAAELDYIRHLTYLDEKSPGLAERFEAEFHARIVHLQTDALWPFWDRKRGLRLMPMKRPWEKYGLFFIVTEDEVQIRAVFHLVRLVKRHLRAR